MGLAVFLTLRGGGVWGRPTGCVTLWLCSLGPQGDFTWNSMSGRSVRLRSVPIQSLSELERARLQEVAFYQLQQDCDLSCQITIPKGKAPPVTPSGKAVCCTSPGLQSQDARLCHPNTGMPAGTCVVKGTCKWDNSNVNGYVYLKGRSTRGVKQESRVRLNSPHAFRTTNEKEVSERSPSRVRIKTMSISTQVQNDQLKRMF